MITTFTIGDFVVIKSPDSSDFATIGFEGVVISIDGEFLSISGYNPELNKKLLLRVHKIHVTKIERNSHSQR